MLVIALLLVAASMISMDEVKFMQLKGFFVSLSQNKPGQGPEMKTMGLISL